MSLPSAQRSLLCRALCLLPCVWLALGILGFQRSVRLIQRLAPQPQEHPTPSSSGVTVAATARMVDVAARHGVVPSNCLRSSLVLVYLLRTQGLPAELQIGARWNDGLFEAHAWVELDGRPLNDRPDVGQLFTRFEQLPHALRSAAFGRGPVTPHD